MKASRKSRSRKPAVKITPFLWFDKEAGEAAKLYTSLFRGSKIKKTTKLDDTPTGTIEIVQAELAGQAFTLMSAGPVFKFNPSVSFLVTCNTREEVDVLWTKLLEWGKPLMELSAYPFSERYGWLQDRYGLSWQIVPSIMPKLLQDRDKKKVARVTGAFLQMKLNIKALRQAFNRK